MSEAGAKGGGENLVPPAFDFFFSPLLLELLINYDQLLQRSKRGCADLWLLDGLMSQTDNGGGRPSLCPGGMWAPFSLAVDLSL